MTEPRPPSPSRQAGPDNLKALLIFLVVFGHLLELASARAQDASDVVYRCVYAFHMPAFIYLTGRFARFRPGRVLNFIGLYLAFQPAYILMDRHVVHLKDPLLKMSWTTPRWILWYLAFAIAAYMLLPLFEHLRRFGGWVVGASVVLGLAVGFDPSVNYYLSLSRIAVFMPFFLMGLYFQDLGKERLFRERGRKWTLAATTASGLLALAGTAALVYFLDVPRPLLHGGAPYAACHGTVWMRGLAYLTAMAWTWFLNAAAPDRILPVVTRVGSHTLGIYLVHGFAIRALLRARAFDALGVVGQGGRIALSLAIAAAIVLALGNPWVGGAIQKVLLPSARKPATESASAKDGAA